MKINNLNAKEIQDVNSFRILRSFKFPTKKHEAFRNIPIESLYEKEYQLELPEIIQDLTHHFDEEDFYFLYIINDKSVVHYSDLPEGILINNSEKKPIRSENAFYYLSESLLEKQLHIHVTKMLDKPLVLLNIFTHNDTFYPQSVRLTLEQNLSVDILDVYLNKAYDNLANVNRTFEAKHNSHLRYYKIQDIHNGKLIINNHTFLEQNAHLDVYNFDLSNGFHINLWHNQLNQNKSQFHFTALSNIYEEAINANIIKTIHEAPNTISNLQIKHILHDKSQATFEALSIVQKEALYSQAYQNSHTILLSNDATIYAKPHLEILVDELQASHGATTGSLNQEHLLYLKSRGINEEKAKHILLKAFEREIYDKISSPKIKTFIKNLKRKRYV